MNSIRIHIFKKKENFMRILRCLSWSSMMALLLATSSSAWGQAPGLAWSNNVAGKAFAVDTQQNVYVTSRSNIIILNSSGSTLETHSICPLPAIAQRDASGNYYFFGSFDGTQDFGGITLVGGWTNAPSSKGPVYQSGWPTCFLAEYSSSGNLQWVVSLGTQSYRNHADDLTLNPDGSLTIGYDNAVYGFVAQYSSSGSSIWQTQLPQQYPFSVKVSPLHGTNGNFLEYGGTSSTVTGGSYNAAGGFTQFTSGLLFWQNALATNSEPLTDANGNLFVTALSSSYPKLPILTKWNSEGEISSNNVGTVEEWQLATDNQYNIYIAGIDGSLSKYNSNGTLIWSGNYGSPVISMILDAQGNRYISRNDGSVAKLLPDMVPAPIIVSAPAGGEIFAGSNFTFGVVATGYAPLSYQWGFQSNAQATLSYIPAATNSTYTVTGAIAAQSGLYSVIVSNVAGTTNSAPVTLTIKSVALFQGSQMLNSGTYHFSSPPTLTIQAAFTNGEIYYSLDGSTPSILSIPYSGPFTLTSNATINAIAYSADFSQSSLADTIIAIVPPQYTLNATTAGGGTISLSPPGGVYASNTVVTATANPASGYSFLYWQGAAGGLNPSANIVMNQNQSLTAVFGTTLSTTVQGNGQVLVSPPGGLYPYGATVRLEGLPQPGNYFGAWGNAASGTTNPLYFTITNPTPTISSLFAPLSGNQEALTLLVLGHGKVSANPGGNVFAANQSVTITATPDAGQSFLYWSGGASGTQNPLSVNMTQSRVIVAHFSGQSVALGGPGSGPTPQGFQLNLMGDPQAVYQIFTSTNLSTWQSAGFVTNNSGMLQLTDPSATNVPSKYYRAVLTQ